MSNYRLIRFVVVLCCAAFATVVAHAATVTVDCGKKNAKSIGATLAGLDRNTVNTVTIAGACTEAVVIAGFKDLTLVGMAGASVGYAVPLPDEDGSSVLTISSQSTVTIRSLTINGGANGISCGFQSNCRLEDVTVQGAAGDGVSVTVRSMASVLGTSRLRNNGGAGLFATGASAVDVDALAPGGPAPAIEDNGQAGLSIWDGAYLRVVSGATIQDNGASGVDADAGAVIRMAGVTVASNGGDGLRLRGANARVRNMTITGNAGHGVLVRNLALLNLAGPRTISGNAAPDVNCMSTTAATVGVTAQAGVASTNCVEPAP